LLLIGSWTAVNAAPGDGSSAIRTGFNSSYLPGNDDGSTSLVPIGFSLNFFGSTYDHLYVNNNGNLTFDSQLSIFTPFPILQTNRSIIAPFFADVDTRGGNVLTYGPGAVGERPAFGATWPGVGCYSNNQAVLDYFQVLLIDRSDVGLGDFDIEFNYDQIQWETGTASGGNSVCQGGSSARVGYSNGQTTAFELPGSAVNGAFLDTNTVTGLIHNSRNSLQPGRYLFPVRNGAPPTGGTISGTVYADQAGSGHEVAGAPVQICGASGYCTTTPTNSQGHYSATGLVPDTYRLTVYPPAGSTLLSGGLGPITVAGSATFSGEDVVLQNPPPPPPTPITPAHSGGGTVVVYWQDSLTLNAYGCAGGAASFSLTTDDGLSRSGSMAEAPPGTYQATTPALYPHHGNAHVTYSVTCPGSSFPTVTDFNIYIDPSGVVKTTSGEPIPNATVTLYQFESGAFQAVPNGSAIMSPSNRNNPSLTDANGLFGWDVLAGTYKVRAAKNGCYAPGNPTQPYVESSDLIVPPAATGVELDLECTSLTHANLSGNITQKTGTFPSRNWVVTVTNGGPGTAYGTQLTALNLTQTFGTACTPQIVSTLPLALNNSIAEGASGSVPVTINFNGCPTNARFRVDAAFTANYGTSSGTMVRTNQYP